MLPAIEPDAPVEPLVAVAPPLVAPPVDPVVEPEVLPEAPLRPDVEPLVDPAAPVVSVKWWKSSVAPPAGVM